MKPLLYGISAAFCFAFTYLLNRSMGINGGYWQWTACLRYLWMVPIMLPVVLYRRSIPKMLAMVKKEPGRWLLWSYVAYVLFYIPTAIGTTYSPAWLSAATWQVTLVAGILMSPLFFHTMETPAGPLRVRHKIPWVSLALSSLVILGVVIVQSERATAIGWQEMLMGAAPTVLGTIMYPLGNRKTMELADGRIDAFERIFLLTILTLPFWLVMAGVNVATIGWPSADQVFKSFGVSFIVSILGTVLFFKAMEMVRDDMQKLAGVEAAQSMEIVFTLLIGMIFLGEGLPSQRSLLGIALVILGIVCYSRLVSQPENQVTKKGSGGRGRGAKANIRG